MTDSANCCPVCNSTELERVFSKASLNPLWGIGLAQSEFILNYHSCGQCGHIYLFPRLSAAETQGYYEQIPAPTQAAFAHRRPMLTQRKAFLDRHLSGCEALATVIEVGPAYGDFLALFPETSERLGIEPSRKYLEFVAAERPGLTYYPSMLEAAPETLPRLMGSADLALSCNVLEHTYDPHVFVESLAALAKDAGFVFIEVPGVEAMADCHNPTYQTVHAGHIHMFSVASLNRLCASKGLILQAFETSADMDYPVLRALFRCSPAPGRIAAYFEKHCTGLRQVAERGKEKLDRAVAQASHAVAWGCGQDLMDILSLYPEQRWRQLAGVLTLVDLNPAKQGQSMMGLKVEPPQPDPQVDLVIIASRSEILRDDIARSALEMYPGAAIVHCY